MVYILLLILFAIVLLTAGKIFTGGGCFAGMAAFLYEKLPFLRIRNDKLTGNLLKLHPQQKPEESRKHFEVERIRIFLLILLVGDLAALFLWIGEGPAGVLSEEGFVLRRKQGEGSTTALLSVRGQNGEKVDVDWTIQEKRYSDEELEVLFEAMLDEIERSALAENTSWEQITGNLNLMDSMEGYPFSLKWESSSYSAVTGDGRVADWEDAKEWAEDGKLVTLSVTATYFEFERESVFYAKICPQPKALTFEEQVRQSLTQAQEDDPYSDQVRLPDVIGNETVNWSERIQNKSGKIFLIGVLGALSVWILKAKELEKQVKNRNQSMEEEYAAIVSKVTLYLGAGLNVKSAFIKIAEEGQGNPAYEEMRITCREIEGGIGEAEAYERFGKRIRLQRYIRLSTLLVQNLQKGNATLLLQLRQEVLLSQEELGSAIRQKGEEISTKLLFPMVLLMGMVMVWIMLPAFLSL